MPSSLERCPESYRLYNLFRTNVATLGPEIESPENVHYNL